MKVPILSDLKSKGETPEYLFWVGCAGSFDDRSKKVTKAFVKILNKANISYAILGKEESLRKSDEPPGLVDNPPGELLYSTPTKPEKKDDDGVHFILEQETEEQIETMLRKIESRDF